MTLPPTPQRALDASTIVSAFQVVAGASPERLALATYGKPKGASSDRSTPSGSGCLRNALLHGVEQVRKWYFAEPWLPGGDELTMTSNLSRSVMESKYSGVIKKFYDAGDPVVTTRRKLS